MLSQDELQEVFARMADDTESQDQTRFYRDDKGRAVKADGRTTSARSEASKKMWARKHALGQAQRCYHPATCDIDYDADTMEFMASIRQFQDRTGRKFPSWSDVMSVFKALGYTKEGGLPACTDEPN